MILHIHCHPECWHLHPQLGGAYTSLLWRDVTSAASNQHMLITLVNWKKKKYTVWELWTKFYLGQNEDYSLGDSISGLRNCSKEAVRKVSLYVILGKGAYIQSSICFSSKVSTGLVKVIANQKQMSPWLIVILSQIWGDARIGLINLSPENISPTIWRSVLQFFPEHRVLYF